MYHLYIMYFNLCTHSVDKTNDNGSEVIKLSHDLLGSFLYSTVDFNKKTRRVANFKKIKYKKKIRN